MRRARPPRRTAPNAAHDRGTRGAGRRSSASPLGAAGNQALHDALAAQREGEPLDGGLRVEMERAFDHDFGAVRIRRDAQAQRETDALGAVALTRGDEIALAGDAPAPASGAGRHLIAHELAHVVQQRRAGTVREDRHAQPGDAHEREADAAAAHAEAGRPASLGAAASVPGTQAQFRGRGADEQDLPLREDVQAAIETFLKRALKAQGTRALTISDAVRTALVELAQAPDPRKKGPDTNRATRLSAVDNLLTGTHPSDPAGLAAAVAKLLPSPFDKAALDALETRPVADPPKKGAEGVAEMARRSLVTKPNFQEEPGGNAPLDRSEKNRKIESDVRGEHSFPLFDTQYFDIARGTPDALKGRVKRTGPRPAPDEDESAPGGPADEAGIGAETEADRARPPAGAFGPIRLPESTFVFSTALPTVLAGFAPGGATLSADHKAQLAMMVDLLFSSANPDLVTEVEIVGHADVNGTEAFNKNVAQQRADAARRYLLGTLKVPPLKIASVQAGGALEAGAAKDPALRARNRSVEVILRSRPRPRPRPPFEAR